MSKATDYTKKLADAQEAVHQAETERPAWANDNGLVCTMNDDGSLSMESCTLSAADATQLASWMADQYADHQQEPEATATQPDAAPAPAEAAAPEAAPAQTDAPAAEQPAAPSTDTPAT